MPTPRFFNRLTSLVLCVCLHSGAGPAYALRIQQSEPVRSNLESRLKAGSEEKPLDPIGEKVLKWYVEALIPAKKRWMRARAASRGTHWLSQGGQVLPRPTTSVPPPFPSLSPGQVRLDPSRLLPVLWRKVLEAWEMGFAEVPLEGGKAVLFFRMDEEGVLLDLFVAPEMGRHLLVGRFDLLIAGGIAVARGAGNYSSDFTDAAVKYRHNHGIRVMSDDSEVRLSRDRSPNHIKSLFLNGENLRTLGLQPDVIADAMALAMAEWLRLFDVQSLEVDTGYENAYLQRFRYLAEEDLHFAHGEPFEILIGTWKSELEKRLAAARPGPAVDFGLSTWLDQVRLRETTLRLDGIGEFPLSKGKAILLFRPGTVLGDNHLRLDLLVQPDASTPVRYVGRFDPWEDSSLGSAGARGAALPVPFSVSADRWLKNRGIISDGNEAPFQRSRNASAALNRRALDVDEAAARAIGVRVSDVETALAAAGLQLLKLDGITRFTLSAWHDDPFLLELMKSVPGEDRKGQRTSSLTVLLQELESRMSTGKPSSGRSLDPARWPDIIEPAIPSLRKEGLARLPMLGGEVVVLLREGDPNAFQPFWDVKLDMFLHGSGRPPAYLGRSDLRMEGGSDTATAKGAAQVIKWTQPALDWLVGHSLLKALNTPMSKSRDGRFADQAVYVEEKTARDAGLSIEQAHDVLALAAVEVLRARDRHSGARIWLDVDTRFNNARLSELVDSLPGSNNANPFLPSALAISVRKELVARLTGAFDPVLAGAEEVRRLAESWVAVGAADSGVLQREDLKSVALEAISEIGSPGVLPHLMRDSLRFDGLWPGQVWSAFDWVHETSMAAVRYSPSGELSLLTPQGELELATQYPPGGPVSLKELFLKNAPEDQAPPVSLPSYLEGMRIPSGSLITEAFTLVLQKPGEFARVAHIPLLFEADIEPAGRETVAMGIVVSSLQPFFQGLAAPGEVKVISHVHGTDMALSSDDIQALFEMQWQYPMLLLDPLGWKGRVFIPKGKEEPADAFLQLLEPGTRAGFASATEADRLQWLRKYFLTVDLDMAALARAQGLLEPLKQRVQGVFGALAAGGMVHPIVSGPGISRRYPGLVTLSGLISPRLFSVDPGNDGTAELARRLASETPAIDQVLYFGKKEELQRFAAAAAPWGVSAGDSPVGTGEEPSFVLALQSLISAFSGLSPEELVQRGVDVRRLAEDLELLAGA